MHTEYSEVANELKYHASKGLCYIWARQSGEEAGGGETERMSRGGALVGKVLGSAALLVCHLYQTHCQQPLSAPASVFAKAVRIKLMGPGAPLSYFPELTSTSWLSWLCPPSWSTVCLQRWSLFLRAFPNTTLLVFPVALFFPAQLLNSALGLFALCVHTHPSRDGMKLNLVFMPNSRSLLKTVFAYFQPLCLHCIFHNTHHHMAFH